MGSRLNDFRKLQGMLSENNATDHPWLMQPMHPELDFLIPEDTSGKESLL